jgi:hypothetical protein
MPDIRPDYPPNIKQIRKVFPLTGNEIFAWDGIIYHPMLTPLPQWLIEHEECHFAQQDGDPEGWWEHYLANPQFRYEQELEAHQVEYACYCRHNKDRNQRLRYLQLIARRLSSPMYGSVVKFREALWRIKGGKSKNSKA